MLGLCLRARLLTGAEARKGWEEMRMQLLQEELVKIKRNGEQNKLSVRIDIATNIYA